MESKKDGRVAGGAGGGWGGNIGENAKMGGEGKVWKSNGKKESEGDEVEGMKFRD